MGCGRRIYFADSDGISLIQSDFTSLGARQHGRDYYKEGDAFEAYVANTLFPSTYYVVENITPRRGDLGGRYIASCEDPDLQLRHKPTNERFYVECKWRTNRSMRQRRLMVCRDIDQLRRYKLFEAEHSPHKVYIVLGRNGTQNAPSRLYSIPIDELDNAWLYLNILDDFERSAVQPFEYRNGKLQ